jgi:hypothetical protein
MKLLSRLTPLSIAFRFPVIPLFRLLPPPIDSGNPSSRPNIPLLFIIILTINSTTTETMSFLLQTHRLLLQQNELRNLDI